MHYRNLIAALVLTIHANFAHAIVFNVQENPNNTNDTFPNNPGEDFIVPGQSNVAGILTADLGRNIALGGLGNCIGFACRDDFDSFRMIVPAGVQISSIEFLVPNLNGTAEQLWIFPAIAGGGIRQVKDNPDWQLGALLVITDNIFIGNDGGLGPNVRTTALGPGSYDVVGWNYEFIGAGEFRADFIATAVVPVPAAIWLMLGGLVTFIKIATRPQRNR